MASAALQPRDSAAPQPPALDGLRHALLTIGVILGMFMQVLDTTIANVALPHMQASLGAQPDTIVWVLTSYIVASAIAIPITGWLAERVGRKQLFVVSALAFAAASGLCAIATSLTEIVLFRFIQGVAGAFLVPLAQSTLFDINPPERQARAMGLFGAGIMVAPILGPVIGGWLTQNYDWRWVFLINIPVGAVAALLAARSMPDFPRSKRRFDLAGFALLGMALAGLQLMLDRGAQLDWFSSWEIRIEAGVAIAGAWMFAVHLFGSRNPLFDLGMFRDRNFSAGLVFMAATGGVLFGGLALLPPMLQGLLNYSVLQAGLLTAPRGAGTLISMLLVGRLVGRIDARLLVLAGLLLMAWSLHQMAGFSLLMDTSPVIVSGVIQGLALGLIFVPLNTLAFATLDSRHRTAGSSLFNLSRSIGGSVSISILSALLARNIQISHADLGAHVTAYNLPQIVQALGASQQNAAGALALRGQPGAQIALLDAMLNQQAAIVAYIDDFHLMMMITLCTLPLLLLLRKARRPAGAPPPPAD